MIRTRFAPSPTGLLHVGSLRSALYNFLFARKHKGAFVLRLEDTDKARTVDGAYENILQILNWAGIAHDEGPDIGGRHAPYIQSERLEIYKKYAEKLLEKDAAYRCFCTAERLAQMRAEQEAHREAPKYDKKCFGVSAEEIKKMLAAKAPHVMRQKIPSEGEVAWRDLIRGEVSFKCDTIDDQILMKSDGYPTYHLASVVDDHLMEITHVIRGEEWLSSTPKHILLYRAFGFPAPEFAHLPLLLNKDKSKLSKRQGDSAADDYRRKGYLPEAMINFIALLGWHPGGNETQEIFSLEELIEKFSLEKVHKAGAVFDLEKLDWMNWQWRKRHFEAQPGDYSEKLLALAATHIPADWRKDKEFLKRALKTVAEKILQKPESVMDIMQFYFKNPDALAGGADALKNLILREKTKVTPETARTALSETIEALKNFDDFDSEEKLKTKMMDVIAKLGLKNGQVLWPVRVALTGEEFSPGVFEILWALGKNQSITRLNTALKSL